MRYPIIAEVCNGVIDCYITVIIAKYLGKLTDAVFVMDVHYAMENIWSLMLCVFLNVIICPLFHLLNDFIWLHSGMKSDNDMCNRIVTWEYHRLQEIPEGKISYRLEYALNDFRLNFGVVIAKLIATPVIITYLLKQSSVVGWTYVCVAFLVSFLKLILPIVLRKINVYYEKKTCEYEEKLRNHIFDITKNPLDIQWLGLRESYLNKMKDLFVAYFKKVKKKDIRCKSIASAGSEIINIGTKIIIIVTGSYLVSIRSLRAGDIVMMVNSLVIYDRVMNSLSNIIKTIPKLRMGAEQLEIFYSNKEDLSGKSIPDAFGIVAKELSFCYEKRKVIEGLSFQVDNGDKVAICGKNGSGKSTLLRIITGLEKGYQGSLYVNGLELQQVSLLQWRRKIAIAFQEPYLFSGTVEENIKLGKQNATVAEVNAVMQQTGIQYLKERNIDYNTKELSGGEKQKISVARALLKNTDCIILDEPNNNLDSEGLEWLKKFILQTSKTILFITHDEALLEAADLCIEL